MRRPAIPILARISAVPRLIGTMALRCQIRTRTSQQSYVTGCKRMVVPSCSRIGVTLHEELF